MSQTCRSWKTVMSLATGCKKLSPRPCLTLSSPLVRHRLHAHVHLSPLICSHAFILRRLWCFGAGGKDQIQYWNSAGVLRTLRVCLGGAGGTAKRSQGREAMRRETNSGATRENLCKNKILQVFPNSKKRTLHSLFLGGSQIQYRVIAIWMCFKNLLSLILINIFNFLFRVLLPPACSPSSCLFFTWLYPGKHLSKTSINWQISRRQQRKLSSHSKVRLTCSECQSSLCLFVVPPPFGGLESKSRRKWPKTLRAQPSFNF